MQNISYDNIKIYNDEDKVNLGQVFELKLMVKVTPRVIPVICYLLSCSRPALVVHLDDCLRPDGLVVQHH